MEQKQQDQKAPSRLHMMMFQISVSSGWETDHFNAPDSGLFLKQKLKN